MTVWVQGVVLLCVVLMTGTAHAIGWFPESQGNRHLIDASRGDAAIGQIERLLSDAEMQIERSGGAAGLDGVLSRYFSFDVWHRFLVKPHRKAFSKKQEQAFRELLPRYVARLYVERFHAAAAAPPRVVSVRKARRDMIVETEVRRHSGGVLRIEWRLRGRGAPSVIDIIGGGASFLLLTREEFSAIIDRGGAEALLQHMHDRAG